MAVGVLCDLRICRSLFAENNYSWLKIVEGIFLRLKLIAFSVIHLAKVANLYNNIVMNDSNLQIFV